MIFMARGILNYMIGIGSIAGAVYLLNGEKGREKIRNGAGDVIENVASELKESVKNVIENIAGGNNSENEQENSGERRGNRQNSGNRIYAQYTSPFEGRENRVYDARPRDPNIYEPTIGVGHNLNRGDSRETFARVLPEVNYDDVYSGRAALSDNQIDRLLENDIEEHVRRARRDVRGFDNLPDYLRQALVDMAYRGDLGNSPNTRRLMNAGNWREASNEYINRKEYRNAEANGMSGLRGRMDSNRDRILRYAEELQRRR